jgi:hypothetical protein
VRHGLPEIQYAHLPLSGHFLQAGRESTSLASNLHLSIPKPDSSLLSNPELKALATAEAVAQKNGLDIELEEGFNEYYRPLALFLYVPNSRLQLRNSSPSWTILFSVTSGKQSFREIHGCFVQL